ncbi:MAG TPA: kelch repeat-containing protein [Oligoflexus sp.]|uniref:kelch repeat-containing protein n=1 Tax=Oligoflexus sp. TaxID=1971216 RepID=UPI002D22F85F|nr:kelch repeat-containing protein [Oligoflexus sp.]HYX33814.1 kelch repeat-containing protein [Oligoflexus sp.]
MRALTGLLLISLGLSGCFNMPVLSKGKVSTLDEAPRLAEAVSYNTTKAISTYDPASKVATTIPAPSGALSGSSVTLPAGALAFAAELVVEEAVPLSQTSVTGSLSISADITITPVGAGLIIRPTQDVDLTQPLTIAMPIDPTAGLRSWLQQSFGLTNSKYYTVFYKYYVDGELKAGVIPTADLILSDTGTVLFKGYFGAYWLAEVSSPILEKIEVTNADPIINKDNVAVVTSTGMVTEAEVVAKASIPPVEWLDIALSFDAAQRAVTATAHIAAGRTLSSCQVDLFEKTDANSGVNVVADVSLKAVHVLTRQDAHTLYARFRCMDDQARQAMSPWSASATIPAVVAAPAPVPVATKPATNFCGSETPAMQLILDASSAGSMGTTRSMTALGSCSYSVDVDTQWGMSFGIQTADGTIRCSSNGVQLGEQNLTCAAASAATPTTMVLPQGNYTIRVDFSASATNPKLSVALQSCALGDLYLMTSYDPVTFPAPTVAQRMNHVGGCQYRIQAPKPAGSTFYTRIQNLDGTYFCGDGTSMAPTSPKSISCGPTPGSYMQTAGAFAAGFQYLLNLGANLDWNGQPTTAHFIFPMETDLCMENRYLLGPTAVGNARQPGVNNFRKGASCNFNYSFIQSGATLTPFFIGVGEGTEKCGVAPATGLSNYVTLDCTASAVAIDMQPWIYANTAFRFNLYSDPVTGKPSYMDVATVNNICPDAFYAVKNSTAGFYPDAQKALTEIQECVYQYDWTPTASNRTLSFVQGSWPAQRCGKFNGFSNPAVGGPAVDFVCNMHYSMTQDFPFTPAGVVDGQKYKVNLDLRLGLDNAKISVANHSALTCPDLHVVGLNGLSYADPSNRMSRTGDCNYIYQFKTPASALNPYMRITDGSTFECGRDIYAAYAYPTTGGHTVPLACGPGPANDVFLDIYPSQHYQLNVHYDTSGNSRISLSTMGQSCPLSTFDGPAAVDQNAVYTAGFTGVENCVEEMLWVPNSSVSTFRLSSNYYGYANICGLNSGSSQISLVGAPSDAICNIFNVTQATNFSVLEGVSPGSKYLVRLDRSGSAFAPPKISIRPVNHIAMNPMGTFAGGSSNYNVPTTLAYPGSRLASASWSHPSSPYKYLFGGYGVNSGAGHGFLSDLWRFDSTTQTWALLPTNDYGYEYGVTITVGTFHPNNRPSARQNPIAVFDPSGAGKLWMFGGVGLTNNYQVGELNDLWVYDLGLNEWALMSGNVNAVNVSGVMGTPGVPSNSNFPGGRHMGNGWVDASGRIYIFGGQGLPDYTSGMAGTVGTLNDMWVYDPTTGYASSTWTFLAGDNSVHTPGTASLPSSRRAAMSWTSAAGHFWIFGGYGFALNVTQGPPSGFLSDMWSFNPSNQTWTRRGGPDFAEGQGRGGLRGVSSAHIWPPARGSSAFWKSPDGKFWLYGGEGQTGNYGGFAMLSDVYRFDPATMQWTWVSGFTHAPMGFQTSYPYHPSDFGTFGVPGSTTKPGSRIQAVAWPDASGNVWIFGGLGVNYWSTSGYLQDLWYLDF